MNNLFFTILTVWELLAISESMFFGLVEDIRVHFDDTILTENIKNYKIKNAITWIFIEKNAMSFLV